MTRKQLEELGLTKEQADKVIEINGADIENAKTDLKSTVKTLEKDKEELQKQINDRDSQLDTHSKRVPATTKASPSRLPTCRRQTRRQRNHTKRR